MLDEVTGRFGVEAIRSKQEVMSMVSRERCCYSGTEVWKYRLNHFSCGIGIALKR